MSHYLFAFTTSHRHFVSFQINDPPLRFTFHVQPDIEMTISLHLFGGKAFNVEVMTALPFQDVGKVADVVIHVLSGVWDAVGLSIGKTHHITCEGFIDLENGRSGQISWSLPTFEDVVRDAGLEIHDWIAVCTGTPQLRAALRDYRLAMETPGEVAVHCYRAIERIRQYFASNVGRKRSWEALAAALNVRRTWLDSYTTHATAVRHGELVELPLVERDACLRQAAIVIIRFAAYLKGGTVALTDPPFPLLT